MGTVKGILAMFVWLHLNYEWENFTYIKMMMQWVPQPLVSCLSSLDIFQPFVAWISRKKYSIIKVVPHVKDLRFLITKVCSLNSYRKNNFFLLQESYTHTNTLFLNSLFSDYSLVAVEIIFIWTLLCLIKCTMMAWNFF